MNLIILENIGPLVISMPRECLIFLVIVIIILRCLLGLSVKLRVIQRVVESALLYELLVISLLDNSAVLYHENGIGILNSGESVCDYKAGLVPHQLVHRALYLYLGTGIDV